MSNAKNAQRAPRVIFFGMQCSFSYLPLQALLQSGIEVCAVVMPASPARSREFSPIWRHESPRPPGRPLMLMNAGASASLLQLAWLHQLPVWEVRRLAHAETVATLAKYQADAICVACFSARVPRVILDLPRLGCVNVHPSLLPANRGPVPLFWTLREGSASTGVTIHLMNEQMDRGDILLQERISVPEGIRYDELEMRCSQVGAMLLARSVWDLYEGRARPVPQDESQSSYQPFPEAKDFVVQADEWDARHVYTFVRGISDWQRPIDVRVQGEHLYVRDAISYSSQELAGVVGSARQEARDEVLVPCRIGAVRLLLGWPSIAVRR